MLIVILVTELMPCCPPSSRHGLHQHYKHILEKEQVDLSERWYTIAWRAIWWLQTYQRHFSRRREAIRAIAWRKRNTSKMHKQRCIWKWRRRITHEVRINNGAFQSLIQSIDFINCSDSVYKNNGIFNFFAVFRRTISNGLFR